MAGKAQTHERVLRRPDSAPGVPALRHALVQLLPDIVDGQVQGLYAMVHDITAVKLAEQSLAQERHLMDTLMATVPDQIYFKDQASRFMRISLSLARRYGLSDPAQAVGKSDADFFTAEHAKATAAVERAIMVSDTPTVNLEEQEYWPDRPPTWNMTPRCRCATPPAGSSAPLASRATSRHARGSKPTCNSRTTALHWPPRPPASAFGIGMWSTGG